MAIQETPEPWIDQVRLVVEEHGDIGTDPWDWLENPRQPLNYLYRQGTILVRDENLRRVDGLVPGEVQAPLVDGLTLYRPSRLSTLEALERIERALGVGVATPNHIISICGPVHCPATEPEETTSTTPDPPVSTQKGCDGDGTLVSVVDTGWLRGAEKGRTWLKGMTGDLEGDAVQPNGIGPYVGHGTFIAGVIRTMAPKAGIRHERVPQLKAGAWDEAQMAIQLDEALSAGPDIICLSSGVTSRNDRPMLGFQVFYERYLSQVKNVVFVASAANQGDRRPVWPAAFPWALSVGALDSTALTGVVGGRAAFSNFGSWVDVYAPGEGLVNAFATGDYVCTEAPNRGSVRAFAGWARWSGTSFSAPLVAGLIAARMSQTGLSARHAADELLCVARSQAKPGVGPVLMPDDACKPSPCCCEGCCHGRA